MFHNHYLYLFVASCQSSTYEVGIQTYDRLSSVDIKDTQINITDTMENDANATALDPSLIRYAVMYYATTNVKVSTTSLKIDVSPFISNVGGNLGLFAGICRVLMALSLLQWRSSFKYISIRRTIETKSNKAAEIECEVFNRFIFTDHYLQFIYITHFMLQQI